MKNKIGIIGNGFVGSAISHGFRLHCDLKIHDKDPNKSMHSMEQIIDDSEFIFICLPTPMKLNRNNEIDLSIIDSVIDEISSKCDSSKRPIVIIKSTVIPGTVQKYHDKYKNIDFVFSPEFLTERSAILDFINSSRVVFGCDSVEIAERMEKLYRIRFPFVKIIQTDFSTAEFIKYMANCFFATKVSFMNEMYQVANKLNIDWNSALNGFVSDGRIGNSHLDVPGHDGLFGFGGKCFPKDINAFINLCNEMQIDSKVLKAVWEKNLEVREKKDWEEILGATS